MLVYLFRLTGDLMKTSSFGLAPLVGLALLGGAAKGVNVNGIKVNARVLNDHPDSVLTITNNNRVNPGDVMGDVTIDDHFTEGGAGANRHDALLSADGDKTPATFDIGNSFTFQALVNLSAGANSPRKEAGIRLNSAITGDALFIVDSDAGEIAAFGAGAPFYLFGNNAKGNGYAPGRTILMGITYMGKTGAKPAALKYFINRDPNNSGGEESSPALPIANDEEGSVNFNLVLYAHAQSGGAGDFIHAEFTKIHYSPMVPPKAP
jgi:hypothetical protein